MKRGIALLFAGVVLTSLVAPLAVSAQDSGSGLITECDRAVLNPDGTVNEEQTKRCGVEEFVNQFVILGQYGITIVVFLAVLMFVYGGFEFITAGGRQSKISSGQNIISGTVIGLLVAFSAYVIINFAVGAITGTATSINPFTAISTVFGNPEQKSAGLTKPFSGDGAPAANNCRVSWDNSCADQIRCADPADQGTSGSVATMQARLNGLGCGCGTIDGCFGEQALTCVRRFQIANNLTPSGTVDEGTYNAMTQASPLRCDPAATAARISATLAALPRPTANVGDVPADNGGCCVVQKSVGATALVPLYCIENLSQRACAGLGPDYFFVTDKRCTEDSETITKCGFCRSSSGTCFQQAGQYWCEQVAKETGSTTPLTFTQGECTGLTTMCGGGCDTTLKTTP